MFIKIRGKTHYWWRAVDQDGTVLALSTCSVVRAVGSLMGMVGADRSVLGAVCQAAVVSPVTSFHVVNRVAISRRYRSAVSR